MSNNLLNVPGASRSSSTDSAPVLKNQPGYSTPKFEGKAAQRAQVAAAVKAKGFIPSEIAEGEVTWFYEQLGIDDTYFSGENVDEICDHIIALFGAKVVAYTKHDYGKLVIDLEKINKPAKEGDKDGALFIHTSPPGVTSTEGPGATCERRCVGIRSANHIFELMTRQYRRAFP